MERENLIPKQYVKIMLFGIVLCGFLFASQTAEYSKAQATLKERGEVYFRFDVASHEEFKKTGLFNDISIDRVTEGEIIAYANQKGFDKFVQHNYYFEVLTPPSLLIDPPMSDTWHDPERGTRFDFFSYPTYQAYLQQMNYYAETYPENCSLDTLGWTNNNRHVMLYIRIAKDLEKTNGKPKYLNTSTIHGDEVLNYMASLHMIDTLLENYPEDARIAKMIDNIDFYYCPSINPDATYLTGDNSVQGARRYSVTDNFDLNRNYPDGCGDPDHAKWGLYHKSADETKAVLALHARYHFNLGEDFHSGAETILWPYGFKGKRCPDENWQKFICKQFADQVHEDCNNNGYLTSWCGTDGMGHLYSEMYEAHGTRLDYQAYHGYGKSTTPETSNQKLLDKAKLQTRWEYLREAYFQMYEHLYTGIQGIVSDSQTNEPIFNANMTRTGDFDNVDVFTDSAGFYLRFTDKGNYTLTFSHEDYVTKEIPDFSVDDFEKKYELNVKLWPLNPTGIENEEVLITNAIRIAPFRNGIKINGVPLSNKVRIGIYTISGKLVARVPASNASSVVWNGVSNKGRVMSNGCYIVRFTNNKQIFSKSFILGR